MKKLGQLQKERGMDIADLLESFIERDSQFTVREICEDLGISRPTLKDWMLKYCGEAEFLIWRAKVCKELGHSCVVVDFSSIVQDTSWRKDKFTMFIRQLNKAVCFCRIVRGQHIIRMREYFWLLVRDQVKKYYLVERRVVDGQVRYIISKKKGGELNDE